MKIGEKKTRTLTMKVCVECEEPITASGLCTYDCPHDGMLSRPKGSVLLRKFRRTDELIEERKE